MTDTQIMLIAVFYIALAVTIAVSCAQDEDSFLWDDDHLRPCTAVRKPGTQSSNRATAYLSAIWTSNRWSTGKKKPSESQKTCSMLVD